MTNILTDQKSIANRFISEIRDNSIQKDSMRFRKNIERIGEVMAYEISKTLHFDKKTIKTPLGEKETLLDNDNVVLASILRAAIPFHQGFLNYFDKAENAFISAYRKKDKKNTFKIEVEYLASPDINNKTVILVDPMLATGQSMYLSYQTLLKKGNPKHIHLASVIASSQAIEYINQMLNNVSYTLWVGDVDKKLNDKSYIIPGLGDAGDLSFGEKI